MQDEFLTQLYNEHALCPRCPAPEQVQELFTELLRTLFPAHSKRSFHSVEELRAHMGMQRQRLDEILQRNPCTLSHPVGDLAQAFFDRLPDVKRAVDADAQAMFEGDPAAPSVNEVIHSYPGFYAIAAYRIAHALDDLGVSVLPRMITEFAHQRTGIDIHPSARIGERFCIDHGTGVVVGETSAIGYDVKLYQGVTLGALSVRKEDADVKRHPTIEDGVVIYAGATILGGDTTIGARSVIGGNVWITESVPADSTILYKARIDDQRAADHILRDRS